MSAGGRSRTVESMKLLSTLAVIPLLVTAAPALAASQVNLVVAVTPPAAPTVGVFGHYVARVTNTGNKNATSVTLTIALPATHTSPQVYVRGNLANIDSHCTLATTTLTCNLGPIARFGGFVEIGYDLKLPYATTPAAFTYTANPIAGDAFPADNTVSRTVTPATIAQPITTDLHLTYSHCTGTGLTSWFECALFPSSQASFTGDLLVAGNAVTIDGQPTITGSWSQTGGADRLQVSFADSGTPVGTIDARGVGGGCFEGPMTFTPPSSYTVIYRICP